MNAAAAVAVVSEYYIVADYLFAQSMDIELAVKYEPFDAGHIRQVAAANFDVVASSVVVVVVAADGDD